MTESTDQLELTITLGSASFTGGGPADQVMAALDKFSELVTTADFDALVESDPESEEGEPAADVTPAEPGEEEILPLFLRKRTLRGHTQTATAIIAWAQKHGGKSDGLRPAELARYWRDTNLREPGNINRDLRKAVRAGLLHRNGGRYTVTGFGKSTIGLDDA